MEPTVQETKSLRQTWETDCLACGPYPCWSISGFIAMASKWQLTCLQGLQPKKLCSETFRPGSSVTNQLSALIQVSGLTDWIGLQVAIPSPGSSPSADWLLCCDVTLGWRFVSLSRFMVPNTIHSLRSFSLQCVMTIRQGLSRRRKRV